MLGYLFVFVYVLCLNCGVCMFVSYNSVVLLFDSICCCNFVTCCFCDLVLFVCLVVAGLWYCV